MKTKAMKLRRIKADLKHRVETGPVQFNDDWPGLFIRGDQAMGILGNLDMAKAHMSLIEVYIEDLKELLSSPIQKQQTKRKKHGRTKRRN